MKCIQCGTDNNLRDRKANNGRCKNCEHPFVFEPTRQYGSLRKLTDQFFAKALSNISAENTLFFTDQQLIYFLDKSLKVRYTYYSRRNCYAFDNKSVDWLMIGGILILIVGLIYNTIVGLIYNTIVGIIFILLGILCIAIAVIRLVIIKLSQPPPPQPKLLPSPQNFVFTESQVSEWINHWTTINGTIQKKLLPPLQRTSSNFVNPEITAYSFDRVVVCNISDLAQFLIANNFPFENNCAVLSITRYPQDIFDTVMEMLRRNPELKVYALHDASPSGVSLVHQLRTDDNWFANQSVTIYDIGILPRQVLNNFNCFIGNSNESATEAKTIIPEVRQQLTSEEIKWLEKGNFVELESFSPRKLLQLVTRGISLSRSPDNQDNLILLGDEDEFTRTGVYTYSVDTFG